MVKQVHPVVSPKHERMGAVVVPRNGGGVDETVGGNPRIGIHTDGNGPGRSIRPCVRLRLGSALELRLGPIFRCGIGVDVRHDRVDQHVVDIGLDSVRQIVVGRGCFVQRYPVSERIGLHRAVGACIGTDGGVGRCSVLTCIRRAGAGRAVGAGAGGLRQR